jgi:hypothetical protein
MTTFSGCGKVDIELVLKVWKAAPYNSTYILEEQLASLLLSKMRSNLKLSQF